MISDHLMNEEALELMTGFQKVSMLKEIERRYGVEGHYVMVKVSGTGWHAQRIFH